MKHVHSYMACGVCALVGTWHCDWTWGWTVGRSQL